MDSMSLLRLVHILDWNLVHNSLELKTACTIQVGPNL